MKKLSKALAALLALCLVASFFPAAFAEDKTETVVVTVEGVTVDGNVTVTKPEGNATGVQANIGSATVKGDVTANCAQGSAVGIYEYVQAKDGASSASVTVEGDVTATGGQADGIVALTGGNSTATANVAVAGDVTADQYGIVIGQYSSVGVIDVLVEGTVEGGKGAIYVAGVSDPDKVKLTLWKAELLNDHVVVQDGEGEKKEAKRVSGFQTPGETLEQNILYIIKMDEAVQGQVTLAGTTTSHDLDCAKEGTRIDVSGENLGSLICDGTTLEQDGNGNYYLVVPKGGGVKLRYPVKVVAAAPAPAADPSVIEVLTTAEHIGLRLRRDGTYVLRLADGLKFYGDYELVDGVPVFTMEDGTVVTAELDENGNYVFTLPYGEGEEVTFTISPNKLEILIKALG